MFPDLKEGSWGLSSRFYHYLPLGGNVSHPAGA